MPEKFRAVIGERVADSVTGKIICTIAENVPDGKCDFAARYFKDWQIEPPKPGGKATVETLRWADKWLGLFIENRGWTNAPPDSIPIPSAEDRDNPAWTFNAFGYVSC